MNVDLRLGDCLEVLKTIPDNSVDSVVTDPPYHLTSIVKRFGKEDSAPAQFGTDGAYARASKGFMGKEWDGGDIAFRTDVWEECLRILKPGGHLLAFSHSRTYHRMGVAIEDAGFEIRDQIMWIYGQGFPKSHNIGKAIDKRKEWDKYEVFSNSLKSKREELGLSKRQAFDKCGFEAETFGGNSWYEDGRIPSTKDYELLKSGLGLGDDFDGLFEEVEREFISNESNWGKEGFTKVTGYGEWIKTKGNSEWEGWGTALKPAHEPIVMARKPLSEKSIAENVLKHGTGGINIDGSRIGTDDTRSKASLTALGQNSGWNAHNNKEVIAGSECGRFPANIIFDEEAGQLLGEASRFFYCPKTSKKDKNEGLDDFNDRPSQLNSGGIGRKISVEKRLETNGENAPTTKNNHPTVKPTDLMRYLINLVTPSNGTTLDPFMGSGSTGKAAIRCGVNFIGIEKEQEYMDIAKARIEHEQNKPVQQSLF